MSDGINKYLEESDKAELLDVLGKMLGTEGCKLAIVIGVPDGEGGLSMKVYQIGHEYMFELYGFMKVGMNIVEYMEDDD